MLFHKMFLYFIFEY